jgi:predicted nucleic acid-binding protein
LTVVLPDTSVWQRRAQPEVANAVAAALERYVVAIVDPVELELLRSAFGARDHADLRREYAELFRIPLIPTMGQRALDVQGVLARRGYHRGPSVTDLLAAAAAEHAEAELWHCDRHFELIADVTGQPIRKVGR